MTHHISFLINLRYNITSGLEPCQTLLKVTFALRKVMQISATRKSLKG